MARFIAQPHHAAGPAGFGNGGIMELRRIVPICTLCKKIRNDERYWHTVEHFMARHLELDFPHSDCPEGMQEALDALAAWRPPRAG